MDPEEDIDLGQGTEDSEPSENQDRNSPQNPSHNPRIDRKNKGVKNEKSSMGQKLKDKLNPKKQFEKKFNPKQKLQDAKEQLKNAGKDAIKKIGKQAAQK